MAARFAIARPPDPGFTVLNNPLAVSRSGTQLAHTGPRGLWLRRLDSRDWTLLAGTEGAFEPTFSPDDAWVAFWVDGQLKKAATDGSGVVPLGESPRPRGAYWTDEDTILVGATNGVRRIPAAGGNLVQVTQWEGHVTAEPQPLPDGEWMIFSTEDQVLAASGITQERRLLVEGGTSGRYLPTGHLIYELDGSIYGIRFDVDTVQTVGGPVPLVGGVARAGSRSYFDVSESGLLVYSESSGETGTLVWVDRDGEVTGMVGEPFAYSDLRLSPDGRLVALQGRVDDVDVWTYDLMRGTMTRRTTSPRQNETPVWSPDGRWLAYTWQDQQHYRLYRQEVGGRSEAEELWATPWHFHVADWTPDGDALLLEVAVPDSGWDISLLPLDGASEPKPFLADQFDVRGARISPDGRWIAYASTETGESEIYLEAFPDLGSTRQISSGGGTQAVWSRDGSELFYRSADALMVVAVEPGPPLAVGVPVTLFEDRFVRPQGLGGGHTTFDVAADGRLAATHSVAACQCCAAADRRIRRLDVRRDRRTAVPDTVHPDAP